MRLAVISDTHLGDTLCQLARKVGAAYEPGPRLDTLLKILGNEQYDYIVLLGDIPDFSVVPYEEAYAATAVLLQALASCTKRFIFVPGNHDFDVWATVEYQVNVINRIMTGHSPVSQFKWSVPAVIDDRPEASEEQKRRILPTVDPRPGENVEGYGGLFLDQLTSINGITKPIVFAYPNMYLVTRDGSLILLTHGHYFQGYWSSGFTVAQQIIQEDLLDSFGTPITHPTLEQFVAVNFPLCQLSCSGVGQAGPLTRVIGNIIAEVKLDSQVKPLVKTRQYLNRAVEYIDEQVNLGMLEAFNIDRALMNSIKKRIISNLEKYVAPRDRTKFLSDAQTSKRVEYYLRSTQIELARLNTPTYGRNLPLVPDSIIFGHTHQSEKWNPQRLPNADYDLQYRNKLVKMYNAGSWLNRDLGDRFQVFSGAEVFIYENGQMRSESVSDGHVGN